MINNQTDTTGQINKIISGKNRILPLLINPVTLVLFLSAAIKFIYVFHMTDYARYLVSDMAGYWVRALERFQGHDVNINQWVIWPPFYHYTLTWFFRILDSFQLLRFKLQAVLSLNIILSTISVYFVYLISREIVKEKRLAVVVAFIYGFFYPMVYFNAFVLSENLAIPALIAAIWFVLKKDRSLFVVISAFLLAIATATRPNMGILGLPLFIYISTSRPERRKALLRGVLFSVIFFSVLALVALENYRVSEGRLMGLSANGGVNFYLSQTKTYRIISEFEGYTYVLIPPATVQHPEYGTFKTNVPIYNQRYFYNLGLEHIKKNPSVWFENFTKLKTLFFGPLFPSMPSAYGFVTMLHISQYMIFAMFLPLGLFLIFLRRDDYEKRKLALIASVPVFLIITHYVFNAEQRYIYSFVFAVFIMFFAVLEAIWGRFAKYKKTVFIYFMVIIAVFGLIYIEGYYSRNKIRKYIKATVAEQGGYISNIDMARNTTSTKTYYLNKAVFPLSRKLTHATLGDLGHREDFFMELEANMDVLEQGLYELTIYSDDGFKLYIDSINVLEYPGQRPYEKSKTVVELKKGFHSLRLIYFQGKWDTGLLAMYGMAGENERHPVGESSKHIKFRAFH